MVFGNVIFPSDHAFSIPHKKILSFLIVYAHSSLPISGVTLSFSKSVMLVPFSSIAAIPSGVRYGFTSGHIDCKNTYFLIAERSTGITIAAAVPMANRKIASEFFFEDIETEYCIVYSKHNLRLRIADCGLRIEEQRNPKSENPKSEIFLNKYFTCHGFRNSNTHYFQ